jgi:hypothetical protein
MPDDSPRHLLLLPKSKREALLVLLGARGAEQSRAERDTALFESGEAGSAADT